MVEVEIKYLGDLRCEAVHGPSGVRLTTDAPVDNEGRGESFSPTDLAATSLGMCMLTIMGIVARRHGIDLGATQVSVKKIMSTDTPRRIAEIRVRFEIPLSREHPQRQLLENSARACPVHWSLHPDVKQEIEFVWTGES